MDKAKELIELRAQAKRIAQRLETDALSLSPAERYLWRLAEAHAMALEEELDRIVRHHQEQRADAMR